MKSMTVVFDDQIYLVPWHTIICQWAGECSVWVEIVTPKPTVISPSGSLIGGGRLWGLCPGREVFPSVPLAQTY